MKGIFFTELLEMVEKEFGWEVTEKIVSKLGAGNNGVYDNHADYPYDQFTELVNILSFEVKRSVPDLTKNFGEYLFSRLVILYRPEFAGNSDIFQFLEQVDDFIHVKMQDRFPDARIRGFKAERISDTSFQITYRSKRGLVDLAIGLFMGCQRFFNEELILSTEFLSEDDGTVRFTLSKNQVLI